MADAISSWLIGVNVSTARNASANTSLVTRCAERVDTLDGQGEAHAPGHRRFLVYGSYQVSTVGSLVGLPAAGPPPS